MPTDKPSQAHSSGGIHVGDVGGSINFSALGDIVGGDKIVNITTTIQISVEAVTQQPLGTTSPYRGLKRFEDCDRELFFGRDQLITSLLAQVSTSNVLLVLGASGSGKSSVVRAGLLPALSRLVGAKFRSFTLVPDVNPFESLRSSLHNAGFSQAQTRDLADAQPGAPSRLVHALQREGEQWLLFVDQFEEIFTRSEDRLRKSFIEALLAIAQDTASSTKLVLAMRADFLDRFSAFPEFAKLIEKNINLVADMHSDEVRLAIEQPSALHGVIFEEGLVEEIIKDVQGQAGSLPMLQYTLNLLWEEERRSGGLDDRHLNTRTYRELGGARGALQKRADEIYATFGDHTDPKTASPKQEIVRQIFLRLVDIAGVGSDDAVWRPVRRRAATTIFSTAQEQELLQELINQKLVVSNREGTEATVEVAHEALFTSWERLKKWIEGGKQVIFARNRLADDARRWHRRQQEDGAGAEEELLSGSRLGQALEMRSRGDFITIFGGLPETETQFLDASAALRDRRRQAEQERHQRELAQAQTLAEEQKKRADDQAKAAARQRRLTKVMKVLSLLAVVTALGFACITYYASKQRTAALKSAANEKEARQGESEQRAEAERRGKLALARQLAARSELLVEQRGSLLETSVLLAVEAMRRVPGLEADQALRRGLALLSSRKAKYEWPAGAEVALSADARLLASPGPNGTTLLWETFTGRQMGVIPSGENATKFVLSPDGRHLAVLMKSGPAIIWDTTQFKEVARLAHDGTVNALSWNEPANTVIATVGSDKTTHVWDASSFRENTRLENELEMTGVTVNPVGPSLITWTGRESLAEIWNLESKQRIERRELPARLGYSFSPDGDHVVWRGPSAYDLKVYSLSQKTKVWESDKEITFAFNRDGRYFAVGSPEWRALVLDLQTGCELARVMHDDSIWSVTLSPNGRLLATYSNDGTVRVWEVAYAGREIARIGTARPISRLAFSADGGLLALIGSDGVCEVWESKGYREMGAIHEAPVFDVSMSSDSQWTAAATGNGNVGVFNPRTGEVRLSVSLRVSIPGGHGIRAILNRAGDRLLTRANFDHAPRLYDVSTQRVIAEFPHPDSVGSLDLSPDGRRVITVCGDKSVRLWSADDAKEPARTVRYEGASHVAFSPDGRYAGVSGGGSNVHVFSADLATKVHEVTCGISVSKFTFSADGELLAALGGGDTGIIEVWKIGSGQRLGRLQHEGAINSVGFSPDGQFLVTANKDRTVRVYACASGMEVALVRHDLEATVAKFSPDGRWIVSGSLDRTARFWDWRPEHLLEAASLRLSRNLTQEEWQKYFSDEPYRRTLHDLPEPEASSPAASEKRISSPSP